MSSVIEQSPSSSVEKAHSGSRRNLILAWTSTGLVIVAIFVGRAVSSGFLHSRGYASDEAEPPGLGFISFLLFALIVLVPTFAALWFGLRAYRGGLQSGLTAATVATVISGGLLLLGLPLFLSRLVGWPVVLALGLIVLFVLAIVFGGCSEIAALSQTVFAGTFAILSRRARPLLTSISVGSAVALVIVAIAPGNFHRRELFHPLPIPDASLAAVGEAIPTFGKILVEGSTLFVPLIVFLALIGARIPYLAGLSALVAGVVLVAATIFAGLAGTGRLPWGRVQFIPIAYVTIAIVLFALILGVERYATLATVVMIVFAVLAVVTTARSGMTDIDDSRRFAAAADRVERSARVDSGAAIVVAAPHDFDYLEYVHADPKFWSNRCMASYYGLTSIRSGR
jgi:hypothetical protein